MTGPMIAGVGITEFGMFVDTPLRHMASTAADRALDDAGADPAEIGMVVFGNAAGGILTGQEMVRAQTALGRSRLRGRPMMSVENACASGSSAFHVAWLAVAAGTVEAAVAVGAEKMTGHDRTLATRALATAVDVDPDDSSTAASSDNFMELYAQEARHYLDVSDATVTDFALVAAKNAANGSRNPIAQHKQALSVEEILAARTIVDPLTRPMCSSIGDGAAAVVVCTAQWARARGLDAVEIVANTIGAGPVAEGDLVATTARRAYDLAGLGPDDLDVVEVHDAAAPAELELVEKLGLAPRGEGARLVRDGTALLEGRRPVNPSGGLLSRGHPIGATGIAQLVELVEQLRGRSGERQIPSPRVALAENAGGWLGNGPAACSVTILRTV